MPPKRRQNKRTKTEAPPPAAAAVTSQKHNDETATSESIESTAMTALSTSRIKTCLYREEVNMAKLKPPALQLIATTTALFLKNLVVGKDESFQKKQAAIHQQQARTTTRRSKRKRTSSAEPCAPTLFTLDMLKQNIAQSPFSDLLADSLQSIKDRPTPYYKAPVNNKKKKSITTKPPPVAAAATAAQALGIIDKDTSQATAATEKLKFPQPSGQISKATIQEDTDDYD
jgi:hypothetical protein